MLSKKLLLVCVSCLALTACSVDEIASDYDVDQLARRVKEQIVEDSIYRNVNTISFIR